MNKCNHTGGKCKIICTDEFGRGDSTTEIIAACKKCGTSGKSVM